MTPYDIVKQHYKFPDYIEDHPLQIAAVNELAPLNNEGHWLDMGTGKTLVATACGLYLKITHGYKTLVVMPPNLVVQWATWLRSITPKLSVVEWRGSPAERYKIELGHADFTLVGYQLFAKDFSKFWQAFRGQPFYFVADEATFIANVGSKTHEKCFDLAMGNAQAMLSGTPINKPMDGYGLMKFTAPGHYRSQVDYENQHVLTRDFFGFPETYQDLDILNLKIMKNSHRILYEDMYPDAERPLYVPMPYDLDPAHKKLYDKLMDEQILALPDGTKIDGTTVNLLRHRLGQIVCNWSLFSGNPKHEAQIIDMIEEKLEELGSDGKMILFCDYKMTVAGLTERFKQYGCLPYNSTVTEAKKEKHKQLFIHEKKHRLMAIQFISGGKGLDGLQHVCYTEMFCEPCQQPRDFHQAVCRVKRTGQKKRPYIAIPIANNTCQVRGFKNLLDNDSIVNQVIRTPGELRMMLSGERWE